MSEKLLKEDNWIKMSIPLKGCHLIGPFPVKLSEGEYKITVLIEPLEEKP